MAHRALPTSLVKGLYYSALPTVAGAGFALDKVYSIHWYPFMNNNANLLIINTKSTGVNKNN